MSRYERGQSFEALCELRDAYAKLTDDDRRSSLFIGDAVIYAEAVMQALEIEKSIADLVADAGITTQTIPAFDPRD
jgi:hypothetical protein